MGLRMNFSPKINAKLVTGLLLCLVGGVAFAATGSAPANSIGEVAQNVQGSFSALAKLISSGAYIAGMLFVIFSLFKFKAHKDQPQQVPIGAPIALLFIGAALIFLPSIMKTAGSTAFGGSASTAGVSGISNISTTQ